MADSDGRMISRRTVAKAAAWSVPVIGVAAVVPAAAASVDPGGGAGAIGTMSVVGACGGGGAMGAITISLGPFPVGAQIRVTLAHSGGGGFTATPLFVYEGTGNGPYIITSPGGSAIYQGVIDIAFTLGPNEQGTVTASVEAVASYTITGDTTGFVTKRRDGHSSNYNQCSAG